MIVLFSGWANQTTDLSSMVETPVAWCIYGVKN